jgi:peptidoglycan/LPS O-acetylase OafA/YrhL
VEIKILTSLRFFLAMGIISYHFLDTSDLPLLLANLVEKGWNAVPFFFILSGFVLTLGYYKVPYKKLNVVPFFTTRFFRLYPSYILALILIVIAYLVLLQKQFDQFAFFSYVFLLQPFLAGKNYEAVYNGPGWSVVTELYLYLLFPLIRNKLVKFKNTNQVVIALIITMLLNVIISLIVSFILHDKTSESSEFKTFLIFAHGPLYYIPTFVMGVFSGLLYLRIQGHYHKNHLFLYNIIFVSSVILYTLQLAFKNPILESNPSFLTILIVPILISSGFVKGWLERLFGHPLLVYLGSISYGMYIFQEPVRWFVEYILKAMPAIIPPQATYLK